LTNYDGGYIIALTVTPQGNSQGGETVRFSNLDAEKARYRVTSAMIAKEIGRSPETVKKKFTGAIDWKISEMLAVRDKFFPEMTLDYLFKPYAKDGEMQDEAKQ
jgi:hypothetical protein